MGRESSKEKIRVRIAHSFGDVRVLDDVHFEVGENEFLCIVGPTGCGKTTLAKILAGLTRPTYGGVVVDDVQVDPQKLNVAFVFQEPSCLPWLTVEKNVAIGLEIKGVRKERAASRIREVINVVALNGFEHYYPVQILGGMKQRVAIARALAPNPSFLIMDEPFAHLDAQTRYYMQLEVRRIWEHLKTTVVFITNNIEEAVLLGDRVIVLSRLPARVIGQVVVDLPRDKREVTEPRLIELRSRVAEMCEAVLV